MNEENKKPEINTQTVTQSALIEEKRISYEDFSKIEMKVGKILSAEPISKSDKLLKLSVDFRESSPRTILSGIARYFPDHNVLIGKKCMFVTNLAPRAMMGMESNGMILALSTEDGRFSLLEPENDIPEGTRAK